MKTLIERIKKPKLILLSEYRMFRLMKASAFSLSIEIALENINVDTFCSVIYHILKDIMTSCRENHSSNVFFQFFKIYDAPNIIGIAEKVAMVTYGTGTPSCRLENRHKTGVSRA